MQPKRPEKKAEELLFFCFEDIYSAHLFSKHIIKGLNEVSFELWNATWSENPAHELKVHKSRDRDVIREMFVAFIHMWVLFAVTSEVPRGKVEDSRG